MNFKVTFSYHSRGTGWLQMILLCREPSVKGRETESPVFPHADARNALLSREFLDRLDVDAEVLCCFLGIQERLELNLK